MGYNKTAYQTQLPRLPGSCLIHPWWWWWVFTDNNTTPTKVVLFCFVLLVGLWQLLSASPFIMTSLPQPLSCQPVDHTPAQHLLFPSQTTKGQQILSEFLQWQLLFGIFFFFTLCKIITLVIMLGETQFITIIADLKLVKINKWNQMQTPVLKYLMHNQLTQKTVHSIFI